jgi:hypothetical protein
MVCAQSCNQHFLDARPAGVVALELPNMVDWPDGKQSILTLSYSNPQCLLTSIAVIIVTTRIDTDL